MAQGTDHELGLGRAVAEDLDPPFVPFGAGNQNTVFR